MWFYRRKMRILWTEHLSNEEVLQKNRNKTDTYTKHQKETDDISRENKEESRLKKYDNRRLNVRGTEKS